MLKRAAKLGKYAGEHSSDEDTSSDESDPRIRAILEQVEREVAEGKLSLTDDVDGEHSGMESEGENDDDEEADADADAASSEKKRKSKEDPKPFCEPNETKTLEDSSEITYTGEKYICSVCPPRNMWLSSQVEMHLKSKMHIKKAGAAKKEEKKKNLTDEQIKTILERKERKRKARFEKSKKAKKAKKEQRAAEKLKNTSKDNADTSEGKADISKAKDKSAQTEKSSQNKPETTDENTVSTGVDKLSLAAAKKTSGKKDKVNTTNTKSAEDTGSGKEVGKSEETKTMRQKRKPAPQKSSGKTAKKAKANES